MSLFTSERERRLWLWALAVLGGIYATLPLAGKLAAFLRQHNLLNISFIVGFFLFMLTIIGSGVARRPHGFELWAGLGIAVVYGMLMVRLFITPEERTHLFEFGRWPC